VLIPVRSVTVADPPRTSIVETMKFVESPKNRKTEWVKAPFHLQPMIYNHQQSIKSDWTEGESEREQPYLEEGPGVWCVEFQFGGDLSEEEDLNGGA